MQHPQCFDNWLTWNPDCIAIGFVHCILLPRCRLPRLAIFAANHLKCMSARLHKTALSLLNRADSIFASRERRCQMMRKAAPRVRIRIVGLLLNVGSMTQLGILVGQNTNFKSLIWNQKVGLEKGPILATLFGQRTLWGMMSCRIRGEIPSVHMYISKSPAGAWPSLWKAWPSLQGSDPASRGLTQPPKGLT